MINKRHSFQLNLLSVLNKLSLKNKYPELTIGLKFLNGIITRNYIDSYWKYLLQIVYNKLPFSFESIPQFIDCLQTMNIRKQNEIVYSIVYLCLTKNLYQFGAGFLQMYHLTARYESELNINTLVNSLNANLQYINWKQAIEKNRNVFHEQIAEKSIFQLQTIIDNIYLSDNHINKLVEIYIQYDKLHEVEVLLENYSLKHSNYINAQKYLFNFNVQYNNTHSIELFNRIAMLNPSDSFVLKHCQDFNDTPLAIDCLFDMLDYYQWKFCEEIWICFNQLIMNTIKDDSIKECINENWNVRKSYWIPYHFNQRNINKKIKDVNLLKLNIAILLLGKAHKFVKRIIKVYELDMNDYKDAIERHCWLTC